MALTVQEINKRIEKKSDEVKRDRKRVNAARQSLSRTQDRSSVVAASLKDMRDAIRHWKHIVADLEDGFRHGGPKTGKEWADERIVRRQETLADEIEDGIAVRDRLLERLDELARNSDRAKEDLKKWLGEAKDDHERLEQLRKRRKQIQSKDGQLSEHFNVHEFDCHNGTPVPKASYDALEADCNNYLEPLRRAGGAVHINSGYRTLAYNASIGGASMSVHVYDASWQHAPWACAVDHTAERMSPSTVQSWHENNTHPDGMGRYSSFTHVDNRNRIGWSDSRWIGP